MKKSLFGLLIIFVLTACSNVGRTDSENYEVIGGEIAESATIDSSQPISDIYDPIEIAEILVRQEMEKRQIDPNNWKITEVGISFDRMIDNIADYDKPVGKMRVVWVTGNVSGINDVGNIDLELYKLDGDNVWYIDEHWGVLRDIEVAEMPIVDESNYQLSTSEELPFNDSNVDEQEFNNQETEDDKDTSEYFAELEQRYLDSMYEHFNDIGLIEYLNGGNFNVKDVEVFENPPAISDRREYTYYLEGTLTSDFNALTENEQFDILSRLNFGSYEFYEGHQFDVKSLELSNGSDIYIRTSSSLEKNGESF
ncbi:membrane lipoprotein lipid attachment site-containing protein [Bacillus sp. FJAT-50079]|uniref:membrane lipoprotein lipid attachment site-containing protein n=1 Tax=Bacillus sp. FJAT-50079 TaxID=2833577 RepID=UPI001BC9E34A|nr:membrane lipoprotein lipid attachment site-containing protein [Bacillus sp. FJAT-50079]MBS4207116.1 membrane lipoprotein lipid attachment site-containing protein [Bacillus sp. FJAT-50079]